MADSERHDARLSTLICHGLSSPDSSEFRVQKPAENPIQITFLWIFEPNSGPDVWKYVIQTGESIAIAASRCLTMYLVFRQTKRPFVIVLCNIIQRGQISRISNVPIPVRCSNLFARSYRRSQLYFLMTPASVKPGRQCCCRRSDHGHVGRGRRDEEKISIAIWVGLVGWRRHLRCCYLK